RCKSCRQPETISDALALPRFTSTTIGMPFNSSPWPEARRLESWLALRPSVETINCPRARNFSQTSTAWSSKPPGFQRKSMINPCMPWLLSLFNAGLETRRIFHRGDDRDEAVLHGNHDAEAAEMAFGVALEILVFFGIEKFA